MFVSLQNSLAYCDDTKRRGLWEIIRFSEVGGGGVELPGWD